MNKKKKNKYLRIITKEELVKYKLVTDKKGNTKQIRIYPKKVLI